MKNILLLISLIVLVLLGAKMLHNGLPQEEGGMSHCVNLGIAYVDNDMGCVLSMEQPFSDMVVMDAESLVGHFRVCGRALRSLVFSSSVFSRVMSWRTALIKMEVLARSFSHFYTSFPRQCWSISSEHYVFGMRRILI